MAKNFFISTALLIALAGCSGEQVAEPDGDIGSDPVKAGAPAQSGPPDLSDVLAFADPSNCTPSESLRDLSRKMVEQRGGQIVAGTLDIPGVGDGLRSEIELYEDDGISGVVATLDVKGTWNGLELREIALDADREALQQASLAIVFASPFTDVVARLNALGFPISRGPGQRDTDGYRTFADNVGDHYVQVNVSDLGNEGGVFLTCSQMGRIEFPS